MKRPVFVELLDEGTDSWRTVEAIDLGEGLFRLDQPEGYDAESESWAFLPGEMVRLQQAELPDGTKGLLATHPNPEAVRVLVSSTEQHAPKARETFAVPNGNGVYTILATPHYTDSQQWQFPPGSIVRLQKKKVLIRALIIL